ncbi:MAG: hypothetical protein KBD06_00460 [Candidatus Pacebacteria bacterium]|nr:hypothetical protein [Candidatus Paceibacterota bacterium]
MLKRIDLWCLIVSIIASLLYVIYLPNDVLLRSVIAFGQAHFLISYIYRLKSGKMDRSYITNFLLLTIGIGLVLAYVYAHTAWFPLVIFVTLTVFVLHYFMDELLITRVPAKNPVFGAIAAFLAFAAVLAQMLFGTGPAILYALTGLTAFFSLFFVYYLFSEEGDRITQTQVLIFFLLNIGVPLYFAYYGGSNVYQLSAFIIMFHYIRWYLLYFVKLYGTPELRIFLDFVTWVHVLVIVTFFQYSLAPGVSFGYLFYSPLFFYGWTLVHIILSIRKKDYQIAL